MKAIRVYEYGGPEQLRLEEVPKPEPQAGELLVRIYAAGVLPIETAVRQGRFAGMMPATFPYTPGTAFAGVVEQVGAHVTAFQLGDAICGRSPRGTYAEYTVIPAIPPAADPSRPGSQQAGTIVLLAHMPPTMSYEAGATLSGGATTAWAALLEDAAVQPGQRVLIHGGAGGVGLFAVQLARWRGAHVIATASAANLDFVRSLGAETVIDYTTTRFEDVVGDVDIVLDTIGGETLTRSMPLVRRGGTLVSVLAPPPQDLAQKLGITAVKNTTTPTSANLQTIVDLIEAGAITPTIRATFPLQEASQAHALSETGHGRGRIVLGIEATDARQR
jgi:NADPH:quinone reductase-like Zn-dependent oxidoreductase